MNTDHYRAELIAEYVTAILCHHHKAALALLRVLKNTTGVPTPEEFQEMKAALEAEVEKSEQQEGEVLPAAFAEFIEEELDLTPLVRADRFPEIVGIRTYAIGDKLMYFHVASKTWVPCEVSWVDWSEERYSVRATFPNGNTRCVGRVPLERLRPF